jgi:AcrR family transcriptional regulator
LSSGLGRRERKKLETRDRIVDCAAALFAGGGYDSTTMDDIADCADVARATVFNYFSRKEDLVLAWFDRHRGELAEVFAESVGPATDTSGRLRHGFRAIARFFTHDPATGRAMVRAWLRAGGPLLTPESETPHMFAGMIRSGQREGDVAADIDPDRAGLVLFDAYLGVLYRWVNEEDDQFPFEQNLIAALDILLAGITGQYPPAGHVD